MGNFYAVRVVEVVVGEMELAMRVTELAVRAAVVVDVRIWKL